MTEKNENTERKKMSVFLVLMFFVIVAFVGLLSLTGSINRAYLDIVDNLLYLTLFTIPLLSIAALIHINLNSERLYGREGVLIILILSCIFIFPVSVISQVSKRPPSVYCATNLKGLGTAFLIYANENNDTLPGQNWNDLLIQKVDITPRALRCSVSDSLEGECDFCLNVTAVGKKLDEIPKDMVLLFEAEFNSEKHKRQPIEKRETFEEYPLLKEYFNGDEKVLLNQWNLVGGPELLDTKRHKTGVYVLFADGHTKFVKFSRIPELNWGIDKTLPFPRELPDVTEEVKRSERADLYLAIPLIISIVVTGCALFKFKNSIRWSFTFVLGIVSAIVGALLGMVAKYLYYTDNLHGGIWGGFFGLLAGVCFVAVLAGFQRRKQLKNFISFSTDAGMLTGIICSSMVHLMLMIESKDFELGGLLLGVPFGVVAGAILGIITAKILKGKTIQQGQ